MNKKCYIMGASKDSQNDFAYSEEDYIIACDGGYTFLHERNYPISLVVGDFDSLGYEPNFPNIVKLNPIKDYTDTHVALKEAMNKGYREFYIYGALEGRMEHSFATIQDAVYFTSKGAKITLFSKKQTIKILHNEEISLEKHSGYISVFAVREAKGVYLKNLKYELDNATLTDTLPLGVSNEFVNKKATIKVTDGYLIVIY